MEPKDRIFAAIRHERTDRTPRGEIFIDDTVVQSSLGCEKVAFEERREFVRLLGLDLVCRSPFFPPQSTGTALPKPSEADWGDLEDWGSRADRFIFVILDGVIGWGMKLFGFRKFMVDLSRRSSYLSDYINAIEAHNLEMAIQARDLGAMGVLLADDLGYQRGLMFNPELLHLYFFPSLARQAETLMTLGLPVFFHSDGNLNGILADLAGMNLAGLHGLEDAAGMDLSFIKQHYGSCLCLWGNLAPGHLVFPRSREEIARQVDSILKAAGQEGGFIFGTNSGLFKGVRPENLRTVYEILDRADQLPI
jgi:uroporphyrinogen decarboxylase